MNKYTKLKVDVKKAIQLYESGLTQEEVGKALGVTQKVIYHRFKEIKYKCRVAKKRDQVGEKNHMWKGKDAGYASLHRRVEQKRGKPRICENCGTKTAKKYDWSNFTKDYSNISSYVRLCHSCHFKLDNVGKNLPHPIKRLVIDGKRECAMCGNTKTLDHYYKDKRLVYGLSPNCKECLKEYNKRYLK